jgi:hypothetical protein
MGAPIGGGVAFDRPGEGNEDPATGKATQEMEMATVPMKSRCRIKAIIVVLTTLRELCEEIGKMLGGMMKKASYFAAASDV